MRLLHISLCEGDESRAYIRLLGLDPDAAMLHYPGTCLSIRLARPAAFIFSRISHTAVTRGQGRTYSRFTGSRWRSMWHTCGIREEEDRMAEPQRTILVV